MIRMRLLKKRFPYAKKLYVQGDIFQAYDKDVRVLTLAKIAEREEPEMAAKKRKPGRPSGTFKKAGEPKGRSTKKSPSARRYQRRDMQAEK